MPLFFIKFKIVKVFNSKKEERIERYKKLLEFNNIPFETDLFTWNNDDLN
mgnify:CR=1 FL=1